MTDTFLLPGERIKLREAYRRGDTLAELQRAFKVSSKTLAQVVTGDDRRVRLEHTAQPKPHGNSTQLSQSDIAAIRRRYRSGETEAAIRQDFKIGKTRIQRLITEEDCIARELAEYKNKIRNKPAPKADNPLRFVSGPASCTAPPMRSDLRQFIYGGAAS